MCVLACRVCLATLCSNKCKVFLAKFSCSASSIPSKHCQNQDSWRWMSLVLYKKTTFSQPRRGCGPPISSNVFTRLRVRVGVLHVALLAEQKTAYGEEQSKASRMGGRRQVFSQAFAFSEYLVGFRALCLCRCHQRKQMRHFKAGLSVP